MTHQSKRWAPTQEDIAIIERASAVGITENEIGVLIPSMPGDGPSKSTIDAAEKRSPALRQAIERGRAKANFNVGGKLYEMAMAGNVAAAIFWLKCRARWKESVSVEHTGEDGKPIQLEAIVVKDYPTE